MSEREIVAYSILWLIGSVVSYFAMRWGKVFVTETEWTIGDRIKCITLSLLLSVGLIPFLLIVVAFYKFGSTKPAKW